MSQKNEISRIPPFSDFVKHAHLSSVAQYEEMYHKSITDPDTFWADMANNFFWYKNIQSYFNKGIL